MNIRIEGTKGRRAKEINTFRKKRGKMKESKRKAKDMDEVKPEVKKENEREEKERKKKEEIYEGRRE